MIVEKLWAAVPESGFVLVALENHFRPVTEAVAFAEILGNAADQKCWLFPSGVKNPSKHRRSGGLTVGATDDDGMFAGEKELFKRFRQRAIRNLFLEDFFQLRISPGDDVGHNHEIGRRLQLHRVKA